MKPRATSDKAAAALEALPKKEKGRLLGYVKDHQDVIRRAMEKGYTYKEIVAILSEADPDIRISEGTLRVYMAQLTKNETEEKPRKKRSVKKNPAAKVDRGTEPAPASRQLVSENETSLQPSPSSEWLTPEDMKDL